MNISSLQNRLRASGPTSLTCEKCPTRTEESPGCDCGRSTVRSFAVLLASVAIATLLISPAHATKPHAGGWKQSLHQAGLLKKSGGIGLLHAKNHVNAHTKGHIDPAQAAVQRLGIHVPSSIAPGPMHTHEPAKTTLFLDKLSLRRDLNPIRFDHYHPVIGHMLGAEKVLKSASSYDAATIALAEKTLLPDTKYYRYFETRRALDPTRFDTYHSQFGPLLAENQRIENLIIANQILTPPGPQSVPEPGMLSLIAVGLGITSAARWFRLASRGQSA